MKFHLLMFKIFPINNLKDMRKFLFILSLFLISLSTIAQKDLPTKPEPPRLVNDLANLFTSTQINSLEKMLVAFDDTTSTQISVVTVSSLYDYDIDEFTDRLAEKWGVGRKGKDNGVMILIKPKLKDGEKGYARISVGYGLEGAIPDVYANRIINNDMIPHFKTGDYYSGALAAVTSVMKMATGEYKASDNEDSGIEIIIFLFFIILIIILAIRSSKKFNNLDKNGKHTGVSGGSIPFIFPLGGGSRGSGGSFGRGGFGGFGGGSFGGGGASGSW